MRFLSIAVLVIAGSLHSSYRAPLGHAFEGKLESLEVASDSGKTSLLLSARSDNPLLHEFRVLCEPDSRRVIRAFWMTKGMFEIGLPSDGLVVSPPPSKDAKARIVFDRASLAHADRSYVTLL